MDKKYFNVIRVYPKIDDSYSFIGMSSEFLDMEGYDRWMQLRQSNTITEALDVFIKLDIDRLSIDEVKYELNSYSEQYHNKLIELKSEFHESNMTNEDYLDYIDKVTTALDDIKTEFNTYLNSNYTKLEV